MRAEALARRAALDGERLDVALIAHLLDIPMPHGAVVGAVWPLPGEPDLRPLLAALHARGQSVMLPETPPQGRPLEFRRWTPGSVMLAGRFGTSHPEGPPGRPDILLVPLLAFDEAGGRLGYGGGYYDRTLAIWPECRSVGFGYAAQRVDSVPVEPHDVRLDAIVTEHGLMSPT